MAKKVSWPTVNSVAVVNQLKPFHQEATGLVYIVNEIKDPNTGAVVRTEDVQLDSDRGRGLVRATILQLSEGKTPRPKEFEEMLGVIKAFSEKTSREPKLPVGSSDPPPKSDLLQLVLADLDFFLDEKGEIRARFVNDHRDFPLKGDVVRAELYGLLAKQNKKVDKDELDRLVYECVRHATKQYRSNTERNDEQLDEESLVYAVVKRMLRLHSEKKADNAKEKEKSPTEMRKALVEEVKEEFPDADNEWPTGAHFTKAMMVRQDAGVFAAYGIKVGKRRDGLSRYITLDIIDPTRLSKYAEENPKNGQQQSPSGEAKAGLGKSAEAANGTPTNGKAPSDAGDAQNGAVASLPAAETEHPDNGTAGPHSPGDAGDAQNGAVASQSTAEAGT